jgi:hypothetical protein
MLIIEDGSGVAGANSYVTVAEIRAYADARSVDLPVSNEAVESLAIKAMDWLYPLKYKGTIADPDQALPWPRKGVYIDGSEVGSDQIPRMLKYAQMAAAIESKTADIMPNQTGQGPVSGQSVGPLSVTYATRQGSAPVGPSAFAKPWALVSGLLRNGGLMVARA